MVLYWYLLILYSVTVSSLIPPVPANTVNRLESRGEKICQESLCKLLRIKRAFKGTANVVNIAVRAGKRAVQKMLQDSKQLSENTLYRNYVKSGGISRAKSDFEALRPNNVLEHTTDDGANVKFGQVGDRSIIISNKGRNGQPFVMIQRRTYPADQQGAPYWHHITYYM